MARTSQAPPLARTASGQPEATPPPLTGPSGPGTPLPALAMTCVSAASPHPLMASGEPEAAPPASAEPEAPPTARAPARHSESPPALPPACGSEAPFGDGCGFEAVTSAVLSTGSPSTAHTVPSSAYSRAVTLWVPWGTYAAARRQDGARRVVTGRSSTKTTATPRPETALAFVPAGEKVKFSTVSRTDQLSSLFGCTSMPTPGALSLSTSR